MPGFEPMIFWSQGLRLNCATDLHSHVVIVHTTIVRLVMSIRGKKWNNRLFALFVKTNLIGPYHFRLIYRGIKFFCRAVWRNKRKWEICIELLPCNFRWNAWRAMIRSINIFTDSPPLFYQHSLKWGQKLPKVKRTDFDFGHKSKIRGNSDKPNRTSIPIPQGSLFWKWKELLGMCIKILAVTVSSTFFKSIKPCLWYHSKKSVKSQTLIVSFRKHWKT